MSGQQLSGYDPRLDGPIGRAYATYDADPRAHGIDGFEAFADAVQSALPDPGKTVAISLTAAMHIEDYLGNTCSLPNAQNELRVALGMRPYDVDDEDAW